MAVGRTQPFQQAVDMWAFPLVPLAGPHGTDTMTRAGTHHVYGSRLVSVTPLPGTEAQARARTMSHCTSAANTVAPLGIQAGRVDVGGQDAAAPPVPGATLGPAYSMAIACRRVATAPSPSKPLSTTWEG